MVISVQSCHSVYLNYYTLCKAVMCIHSQLCGTEEEHIRTNVLSLHNA